MTTTKFKQFIKLGLACAAISLSMGAHGADNNPHLLYNSAIEITQANHVDLAKQVANDSAATHKTFSADKFYKKYHINSENITITPLYLKDGMPFSWKNSQIIKNPDNPDKFNIVLVLDKNGDLYGIDQDFKGKNKLTQTEKDLFLEQTLLHEYAHTHFFEGNKVNSSKLTSEENTTFNHTFLSNYQNLSTNNVYMESAAEISSTVLLINDNQNNLPTVKGLLKKINDIEIVERNAIIADGGYDSHLMMYKGQQQVLKDFNQFKNMNLQDVLNYTKPVTSDLVVEYATKFNSEHKLLKTLEGRHYNEISLVNILQDLKDGKNLSQDTINPTLYTQAQNLFNNHPEFKKGIIFLQEENTLSLNLKTLYIAADVKTNTTYPTQLSYGNLDESRADVIFDAVHAATTKLMKNDTTTQAAALLNKLESQYKASPATFETLPEYKINHSLSNVVTPTLNKFSVMDNIKKMKEQTLGKTHGSTLKM